MSYIPCIICGKRCIAKTKEAIVKICKTCRTDENIAKVKKMSLEEMTHYRDTWLANGFDQIPVKKLEAVKVKLPEQPIQIIRREGKIIINDFGEPLV